MLRAGDRPDGRARAALLDELVSDFSPLAGIRIVDVTASLAGPTCTQLLGALGAEVIKVEPPDGDHARSWGPPFVSGMGALFFAANAGKRSVVLDLAKDRDALLELVDGAD